MYFQAIKFCCLNCKHATDIYFESKLDISGLVENSRCKSCGYEGSINIGDLGYRTDLPDPDFPPWQAQFIRKSPEYFICTSCNTKMSSEFEYQGLEAICPICNVISMKAISSKIDTNPSLQNLLEFLMRSDTPDDTLTN